MAQTHPVGISSTRIESFNARLGLDGIGIYTAKLLAELPRLGQAIQPYYFPPARPSSRPASPVGTAFPLPYAAQALASELLGKRIRLRGAVSLFHATDYHLARMDVPVVATLHDAVPLAHPEWTAPSLRRAKTWLMRRIAVHADRVIAVSHSAVPELVEHFKVAPERITVIPNGVDESWLTPPDPAAVARILAQYQLLSGYFLFVGTLQPRKNVGRLVAAYLALPAATRAARALVIVGRPGWRCEEDIDAIERGRRAGADIRWLQGIADESALRTLYAGAGVFVFPSLFEGFGIPVLEAFAAGVPAVVSNTSSLPEIAGGAALEVDPRDVAAISHAMHRLADETILSQQCRALGLERARAFTWQNTARLTAQLYKTML